MHKHMHAAQSSPFPLSDIDTLAAGRLCGQPSAVPTLGSALSAPQSLVFHSPPLLAVPSVSTLPASPYLLLRLAAPLLCLTSLHSQLLLQQWRACPLDSPLSPPSHHPLALTHSVNHCPRFPFPRLSYSPRVGALAPPTGCFCRGDVMP